MKTPIIRFITLTLTSFAAMAADAPNSPTASELLAKYTAALDNLKSISLSVEGSSDSFNQFFRPVGPTDAYDGSKISGHPMKTYSRFEVRSDGEHHTIRLYEWGNVGSATRWTPAEQPAYNSTYWDGRQKYDQNKGVNKPGSVGLVTLNNNLPMDDPQVQWHISAYGEIRGYLPPAEQRLDAIARAARSLSVRQEIEEVNGSACYVIDAVTEKGKVCLWIDPAHGYMAARATQSIGAGNVRVAGQRVRAGNTERRTFEVTRFEQKGDVWIPMEIKVTSDMNFATTREFSHATATYKCTEVILNPDHATLHSFDWKFDPELKEGAKFHFSGQSGKYIWKNGTLAPEPIHPRSGTRPRV